MQHSPVTSEAELLRELSRRSGLPESAAELVVHALRDGIHEGVIDERSIVQDREHPREVAAEQLPIAPNPEDPTLVEALIARARKHPLGIEFLVSGFLASVAIALGAHAFTVEAARARIRKEKEQENNA